MGKIAFLFPGQGSQYVGMGRELCEQYPGAREHFDRASEIIGTDLTGLCFDGPQDELRKTHNTQPALFVKSWAVWSVLRDSLRPDLVAGHSLGEYSALAVAGSISFEDGVRAVRKRGELMWESGVKRPGTMAAVLGLSTSDVEALCDEASQAGAVQPANLNCPGQVVVSGEVAGVERVIELAPERGAKLAKKLDVSGAFHSELMEDAKQGLADFLDGVEVAEARIPVVSNVRAAPVTDGDLIRRNLVDQMTSPVRWEESMRFLLDGRAAEFYEIGTGKVLSRLLRSIDRSARCTPIGKPDQVESLLARASGGVS